MKQRSTNILAYSFQLLAVLLVFGYAPPNKNGKVAARSSMHVTSQAAVTPSVQFGVLPHLLQLPLLVNTLYW